MSFVIVLLVFFLDWICHLSKGFSYYLGLWIVLLVSLKDFLDILGAIEQRDCLIKKKKKMKNFLCQFVKKYGERGTKSKFLCSYILVVLGQWPPKPTRSVPADPATRVKSHHLTIKPHLLDVGCTTISASEGLALELGLTHLIVIEFLSKWDQPTNMTSPY